MPPVVAGHINSERPERRQARELDEEIRRLERLRDEIDPTYAPSYIPEQKPQGWFGRMCSRISFWLDMIIAHFLVGVVLLIGGLFLWGILRALIERLF